ncbi:aminopeptidase [Kaistella polysaccharea]|uniref:aminopeptidase n=1 Tax=Kaistella polysaccharea TaxID=2878534 RepID=UPI001CF113DD|nr:aminopeptidase [Kaistella polysaccharea]
MKRYFFASFFLVLFAEVSAQQDSIYISAKVSENRKEISVEQTIVYYNAAKVPLDKIKLLNWSSAYKNRNTPLLKRTLEDRKNDLYFANKSDLASVENLKIKIDENWVETNSAEENIYLPLQHPLKPGESKTITLQYLINVPDSQFTGYGTLNGETELKYFFIVPDGFEDENQSPKYYRGIEENQSPGNFWKVNFILPQDFEVKSNLAQESSTTFSGKLLVDPEFLLTKNHTDLLTSTIDGQNIKIQFGYSLEDSEKQALEFFLPLHLQFIKRKLGALPDKIFISEKFRDDEDFVGIDDIKFWKFHFKLFTDYEKTDLTYFSILSQAIMQNSAVFEKNEDHWLTNGLKSYLEIQYLHQYYNDRKLLGDLPENAKIFGIKPLKFFHASDLKLTERYGLAYQYMLTQNLDQKIGEDFVDLSNFNATAISHFETGSLFSFLSEKMGHDRFAQFLQNYIAESNDKRVDKKDFLEKLTLASGYSADFLEGFIEHKNRVNFRLKRYRKMGEDFQVKVSKNTTQAIPFKIETEEKSGISKTFWFDTDESKKTVQYNIPQSNAEKIIINDDYIFPEKNFRDNYLYTKGLFANTKKIKLKLLKDIPNPEYNEIYLSPRFNFNAYDKVLFGLNIKNTSLFERKFTYSFTPYYSSGTGKLAGSSGIGYSFQPAEAFYRSLDLGISASHFHYDYDLTYRKLSASANLNFAKNPRTDIRRNVAFSYNYLEKDVDPKDLTNTEYSKYNLWNLGYGYSDRRLIHEKYFGTGIQWMEDFQKITTEVSYRYEYAKDKKISLRFFGGYFISNNTKNNLFDYGISRVSNYAFSYGLLGQSATSGVLAQQLIVAEGGFKSYIGTTANQWISTVNVDTHVWRWFNVYADAGIYKNKYENPQFIWDSGVKLKVIPDFLEVYFPIQSSLGFEPSFKDYGKRIRFTLSLNFSAITSYLRRGWF